MALRIVLIRPELGVMVEMPTSELARRNPARRRIQQAQDPGRQRPRALEHVVVQHLVQQDREVEDREALHEGQRNPDERVFEADEAPGRKSQDDKLPNRQR